MSGEQPPSPPSYELEKGPAESMTAEPPPYSYPPTQPGISQQPPPANPAGYPQQPAPPNPAGYPQQPAPANPAGYPQQPPPVNLAGYPQQPPIVGQPGYLQQPPPAYPVPGAPLPGVDARSVIVTQPPSVVVQNINFRETPTICTCPNCHNQVTSQVTREVGGMTWLLMGGILVMGCWMGCCLIPLCIDFGKDAVHKCPTCNYQLGRFSHI